MNNSFKNDSVAKLLINCLAGRLPKPKATGPVSWEEVIKLALAHRVIPMLYLKTKNLIPSPHKEQLYKNFLANATRNTLLTEELVQVLSLLAENEIDAVPFKGPALALQAYGDLAKRQFDDLDLLLPQDHILKAVKLLTANGYILNLELSDSMARAYLRSRQDWVLCSGTSDINLDIKPSIVSQAFQSDRAFNNILKRRVKVNYEGRSMDCLAPVDNLEAICLHGMHHLWWRLSWILDIAALAEKLDEKDWEEAVSATRKRGTLRVVLVGLNMAKELMGTSLPGKVENCISSDPMIRRLTAEASKAVYAYPEHPIESSRWAFWVKSMATMGRRMRLVTHQMLVPSRIELNSVTLPDGLYFLYYIIRPIRLIRDYFKCRIQD